MAKNGAQRRRYSRVRSHVLVSIQKRDANLEKFFIDKGTIRNISAGGLLLHVNELIELDAHIIVSFSLPGADERLDFVAKVLRVEELTDGTYEIGVMFVREMIGDFEKLHQYVFDNLEI